MKLLSNFSWLLAGVMLGAVVAVFFTQNTRTVDAKADRFEDFVMCTGPVATTRNSILDGIWLLDYKAGKLLGSVIDRNIGKIINWAEVDLVQEFGVQPKQNVHFMMTTGSVTHGQAALYVAETTTGKFAVYTMGPRTDNLPGVTIRRHDQTTFRKSPENENR